MVQTILISVGSLTLSQCLGEEVTAGRPSLGDLPKLAASTMDAGSCQTQIGGIFWFIILKAKSFTP